MLVLGDLGVGKTTLCRTLLDLQERKSRAALVGNALLSPDDLLRLMLQDLGAVSKEEVDGGRLVRPIGRHCSRCSTCFSRASAKPGDGAVVIVDEAHSLPPATKQQVIEIASLASNRDHVLQFLLAGQPAVGGAPMVPALLRRSHLGSRAPAAARARRVRALCHSSPRHRRRQRRHLQRRGHRGDLRAVGRRAAAGQPAVRARAAGRRRRAGQSHRAAHDRVGGIGAGPDSPAPERFRWYATR